MLSGAHHEFVGSLSGACFDGSFTLREGRRELFLEQWLLGNHEESVSCRHESDHGAASVSSGDGVLKWFLDRSFEFRFTRLCVGVVSSQIDDHLFQFLDLSVVLIRFLIFLFVD